MKKVSSKVKIQKERRQEVEKLPKNIFPMEVRLIDFVTLYS